MGSTTLKTLLMATSILATAGFAHAADTTLTIESWRTDDLADLAGKAHSSFRSQEPRHQGQVRSDASDGI